MKSEVQEFLREHNACSNGARFALRYNTMAEVWENCERGDWLWWMLCRRGPVTKKLSVEVTIVCAEHVLTLYETEYPTVDKPRKAIESGRAYLMRPCKRTRAAAAAAAAVAYAAAFAAADVAFAAAADAYAAAFAAADAAYAAADVAYAAAAADAPATALAAVYAAAAADAADAAERKWQADAIRELVGLNPFA